MKKNKIFLSLLLSLVIFISILAPTEIPTSAYFFTKKITDTTTISNILNIVKQNDGQDMYNKMYYIFYQSQYAAAYNKSFPYLNSGSTYNYVVDNGTTYYLDGKSKGCYLYADYVSKYVYGFGSHSSKCKSIWINQTGGTMTTEAVKSVIKNYAQAGEHICVAGNTHSLAFVAYDNNGFYYTDYNMDSDPRIFIRYTTWENFKNECNSRGQPARLLDFNLTPNNSITTVTISLKTDKIKVQDNNAFVVYNINKPYSANVSKIGIKVRKEGDTYENGWDHFQPPIYDHTDKTDVPISWDFVEEVKFTPTHATKYYYTCYAEVNGKEYWSDEYSITTTGSHSYGSWTTISAATCTTAGSAKRTCSCGKIETKTLTALGHNYSSSWTTDSAATCTTAGSKSKHCTRCSAKTSVTAISATGHSFGSWSITTKATCTTSGEQKRTCSACKKAETKSIAATGHTYSDKWTIDKAETCTVAGTKSKHCQNCSAKTSVTTIKPTGHKWSSFEVTVEPTTEKTGVSKRHCENCAATESKTIPKIATDGHTHTFGDFSIIKEATCTKPGEMQRSCAECKESETQTVSPLGHSFGEWGAANEDGIAIRSCSNCEVTEEHIVEVISSNASSTIPESDKNNESTPSIKENDNKQTSPVYWVALIVLAFAVGGATSFLFVRKRK